MVTEMKQVEKETYTARELIDMALEGHYLLNDVIFEAVWRLYGRYGEAAKLRLYALPDVSAYASIDEIDVWAHKLLEIEIELDRDQSGIKLNANDRQLSFPWS